MSLHHDACSCYLSGLLFKKNSAYSPGPTPPGLFSFFFQIWPTPELSCCDHLVSNVTLQRSETLISQSQ